MKKFLMILFSFLFISSAFVGGSLLLSGCNSSNVSENLPNDPTDVPSSDPSDEENDNTSENPGGDSENENDNIGEGDNDDSDDVNANSINFSVRVRAYVPFSSTPVSYSSLDFYVGKFDIHWCEGDGKSGHGDAKTWGNTPSKSAAYGYSVVGGGSGDTYARNLDYFSYSYGMNVQRYAWINCSAATNFVRWSVNTSSSFESSRQSTGTTSGNVFLYGNGITSTSKPSSSVGTTMSGIWYVKYRAKLTMKYDLNGGSGSSSTFADDTFYAGQGLTLPSTRPTRTGYTFAGWEIKNNGKNIVNAWYLSGATLDWDDLMWPSSSGYSYTYTATAQWEQNEYTNTYYYRNTSGTQTSTTQTHTGTFTTLTASSINEYVSNGWTLDIWGTSSSATRQGWLPGEQITSNSGLDMYAISRRLVSILYNTGGGSSVTSSGGYQYWNQYGNAYSNPSLTISSTEPTRTGYNFLGWSTSSSATTVNYDPGDTYTFSRAYNQSASVTLYAVWERDTYTNYYRYRNTRGSTTSTTQTRTYGQSFTTLTTSSISEYVSNGWSLYGWATSSTTTSRTYATGASVTSTTYTNSTSTLYWYAISSRTVSITYNTNGGSFSTTPTTSGTQRWNQYGNAITTVSLTITSTEPTRSGYNFLGWATSSSATTVNYDPGDTYNFSRGYGQSASVTLYAVWERESYNLTINFAYNYGTYNVSLSVSTNRGTLSSSSMSEGGSVTLTSDGTTSTHTVTIRETSPSPNYFYVGTSTTPTSLTSYSYNWTPTSNKSINIYTEQRYSITYNGNGNTGGSTSTTYYRYGTGTIANCGYTRTGYDFAGWATSSSGGVVYDYGDTIRNSYLTLYAVWTPKIITVNLNKNEGSGGTSTIYLKYNSGWYSNSSCTNSITSITKPTRTGWTFNGYKESANGTGTTLIDADGNITASKTFYYTSGTKTIYAVWLANNQAHYDSEGGYWYVEIGNMPQSKVDDALKTTLSSNWASLVAGDSYYFAGMTLTSKVYNNEEYCEYNGEYYLVEPIKWRLTYSSNQTSGYGTTDDTLAIMATIVYVGQYSDVEINAGAGYSSLAVTGVLNNISETGYFVSETKSMPTFGTTSLNGTAESVASNIFVASSEEIEEVAGSGKIGFSDLVKAYLLASGKDNLYFTSDLGTNYNNIFCMNGNGDKVQYKAQNYFGVQFSVLVSEYACV